MRMSKILLSMCLLSSGFFPLEASLETPSTPSSFSLITQDSRLWSTIPTLSVSFPPSFLMGIATATWQDSGALHCPDSQWTMWEKKCVKEGNRSHLGAQLFSLYKTKEGRATLIDRLQKLHVNCYRFSIEWSQIEPQEGLWNQEILNYYVELCQDLQDAGIAPMVTLHHFSEPLWFHEKGSFSKEENIPYFVNFAIKVSPILTQLYKGKPLVEYICTINEPAIDGFSRYVRGAFSPGQFLQFELAGRFTFHALQAHSILYPLIKQMSPTTQVGIVHQRLTFVSSNPLFAPVTSPLNQLLNEAPLRFLSTGHFSLYVPFLCSIDEMREKPQADFLGLQYYARPVISLMGSSSYHEPMTEMPMKEDPEGLYEAIVDTYKKCSIPIIVTENGISTHSEAQRARYLSRALYALKQARDVIGKENLKGYVVWCFCKNAEWDMGIEPQNFGAYLLDENKKLTLYPQAGMNPFIQAAITSAAASQEE